VRSQAALLAHDAEAVSSSCADDAESALQSEDANATVDFRVLRGVLLRRWLPGGTPSEVRAAARSRCFAKHPPYSLAPVALRSGRQQAQRMRRRRQRCSG
jgi:hypothetical protein